MEAMSLEAIESVDITLNLQQLFSEGLQLILMDVEQLTERMGNTEYLSICDCLSRLIYLLIDDRIEEVGGVLSQLAKLVPKTFSSRFTLQAIVASSLDDGHGGDNHEQLPSMRVLSNIIRDTLVVNIADTVKDLIEKYFKLESLSDTARNYAAGTTEMDGIEDIGESAEDTDEDLTLFNTLRNNALSTIEVDRIEDIGEGVEDTDDDPTIVSLEEMSLETNDDFPTIDESVLSLQDAEGSTSIRIDETAIEVDQIEDVGESVEDTVVDPTIFNSTEMNNLADFPTTVKPVPLLQEAEGSTSRNRTVTEVDQIEGVGKIVEDADSDLTIFNLTHMNLERNVDSPTALNEPGGNTPRRKIEDTATGLDQIGDENGGVREEYDSDEESVILSLRKRIMGRSVKKIEFSPESPLQDVSEDDDHFADLLIDSDSVENKKRNRQLWDYTLVNKLVRGINTLGAGNWAEILRQEDFPRNINNNDLRYKWRNLLKYNHVVKKERKWHFMSND